MCDPLTPGTLHLQIPSAELFVLQNLLYTTRIWSDWMLWCKSGIHWTVVAYSNFQADKLGKRTRPNEVMMTLWDLAKVLGYSTICLLGHQWCEHTSCGMAPELLPTCFAEVMARKKAIFTNSHLSSTCAGALWGANIENPAQGADLKLELSDLLGDFGSKSLLRKQPPAYGIPLCSFQLKQAKVKWLLCINQA